MDVRKLPVEFAREATEREAVLAFLREVISLTLPHVCCYKVQKAFYERYSPSVYRDIVGLVREHGSGIPVFLDAKTGDIENTMEAYLSTYFGEYDFDGLVLNPYMGSGVWGHLEAWPGKAGIVLARTSGGDADLLQKSVLRDGRELWMLVLDRLIAGWEQGRLLIPVLSSLDPCALEAAARMMPSDMPVFIAGVGAQGGSARSLGSILGDSRLLMINSSRAILFPYAPTDPDWRTAVVESVRRLQAEAAA